MYWKYLRDKEIFYQKILLYSIIFYKHEVSNFLIKIKIFGISEFSSKI